MNVDWHQIYSINRKCIYSTTSISVIPDSLPLRVRTVFHFYFIDNHLPFENSKSQSITNLSRFISSEIFDHYGTDISSTIHLTKATEFLNPRLTLQNATSSNATLSLQLYKYYKCFSHLISYWISFIQWKSHSSFYFQIWSTTWIEQLWWMDSFLSSQFNQWKNLYFIDNHKRVRHRSLLVGIRQSNSLLSNKIPIEKSSHQQHKIRFHIWLWTRSLYLELLLSWWKQ